MSTVTTELDRRVVPDEATALLTVKVGEASRTSRKHLTVMSFGFLLSEGLDVFRAKANQLTDKVLESFRGERHVREDPAIYMRPGAHSKQAELVQLMPDNFEDRVARSYRNYLKRKTDEPFQCEVYIYVKKVVPPRRRRLKEMEMATAVATQHADFVQSQRMLSGANAVHSSSLPVGKRKRSVGSEEADEQHQIQQALQGQQAEEGGYYRTVRMVINGAIVPVQVNVQDLLGCLALLQQQPLFNASGEEDRGSNGAGGDQLQG